MMSERAREVEQQRQRYTEGVLQSDHGSNVFQLSKPQNGKFAIVETAGHLDVAPASDEDVKLAWQDWQAYTLRMIDGDKISVWNEFHTAEFQRQEEILASIPPFQQNLLAKKGLRTGMGVLRNRQRLAVQGMVDGLRKLCHADHPSLAGLAKAQADIEAIFAQCCEETMNVVNLWLREDSRIQAAKRLTSGPAVKHMDNGPEWHLLFGELLPGRSPAPAVLPRFTFTERYEEYSRRQGWRSV